MKLADGANHYSPVHRKYGAPIMKALRVAGALTVLGIGGLVVGLIRRERAGVTVRPIDQDLILP